MRGRITLIVIVITLFVLFGGLSFAVNMYFDYLWFQELGKATILPPPLLRKASWEWCNCLCLFISIPEPLVCHTRSRTDRDRSPDSHRRSNRISLCARSHPTHSGSHLRYVRAVPGGSASQSLGDMWRWIHRVAFGVTESNVWPRCFFLLLFCRFWKVWSGWV